MQEMIAAGTLAFQQTKEPTDTGIAQENGKHYINFYILPWSE
jgi:hypothetical protein